MRESEKAEDGRSVVTPTVQQWLGAITSDSVHNTASISFMSSQAVDYDALAATTSVEEITENEINRDTLRTLKSDNLPTLRLCWPGQARSCGDYVLGGSKDLGWLSHFVKQSTRLESFDMYGYGIFDDCSEQSVERFFEELGRCNQIKRMDFVSTDLAGIIYKLGPAMKNNSIIHWNMEECYIGAPGATFLFNTLRDMNSLEELYIDCELDLSDEDSINLDDGAMAGCISSLAAHSEMRNLTLRSLNMSTHSCAALSGILPRMAGLQELHLGGNPIDDACVEVLVRGLSECNHLQSLILFHNMIGDDGLDVLIRGLPTSVDTLNVISSGITLARQVLLLRFKKLFLVDNALSPDGPRVIAASLANPECRLEELYLDGINIEDEGAAILASSLRGNQRLTRMWFELSTITANGWNVFSSVLCDKASINATHASNHTLQSLTLPDLGGYSGANTIPQDIEVLLDLNSDQDKNLVAATKILQTHRHLDMRPLFGWEMGLLPYVVAWLECFAESRLDLKLSSIFEFVREMPLKVTGRAGGETKGKKRKLNS